MLIQKLEKQVEEYFAAPLSNGTSLSEGLRLLKNIHGFENRNNPGICLLKFLLEILWVHKQNSLLALCLCP